MRTSDKYLSANAWKFNKSIEGTARIFLTGVTGWRINKISFEIDESISIADKNSSVEVSPSTTIFAYKSFCRATFKNRRCTSDRSRPTECGNLISMLMMSTASITHSNSVGNVPFVSKNIFAVDNLSDNARIIRQCINGSPPVRLIECVGTSFDNLSSASTNTSMLIGLSNSSNSVEPAELSIKHVARRAKSVSQYAH